MKVTDEAVAAIAQERAEALLRRPLTADSAVQIAILKNRGLQAAFNELGVAEAVYVKATLPPAPRFSASRLAGSFELEIERQILIGLFELATLPQRAAIAEQRFRAAQFRTAEAVLRLAADARRQYYRDGRGESAGRVPPAGSRHGRIRLRARQAARRDRCPQQTRTGTRARLLHRAWSAARPGAHPAADRAGASHPPTWAVGSRHRLPPSRQPAALPGQFAGAQDLEREAMRRRVDVEALRYDLRAVAGQFGLANATRFVTDVELAGMSKYERKKSIRLDEHGDLRSSGRRSKARARGRVRDPNLRLRPGQRPQCTRDLYGSRKPPRRARRERTLGSSREPICAIAATTISRATIRAASCRFARPSRTKPCCTTAACWWT